MGLPSSGGPSGRASDAACSLLVTDVFRWAELLSRPGLFGRVAPRVVSMKGCRFQWTPPLPSGTEKAGLGLPYNQACPGIGAGSVRQPAGKVVGKASLMVLQLGEMQPGPPIGTLPFGDFGRGFT